MKKFKNENGNKGESKSKKLKITVAVIACALTAFFGTYGISRLQLATLNGISVYGDIEANEWNESIPFDADEYFFLTAEEGAELKVLMLTDTHFNNGGWYARYFWAGEFENQSVYADIKKLVKTSEPDFIYLTGDIETDTLNDVIFEDFCDFMAKFDIPWTMTMGNHDGEQRADKAKIAEILSAAENCVFDVGYTNLNGLGNTVIPVKDGAGAVLYAFVLMDAGDWQLKKDPNKQFSTYEAGYTERQLEWYEWVIEGLKSREGRTVGTMLLTHIPFHAVTYAAKLVYAGIVLKMPGKTVSADDKYIYGTDPFDTESEFGYENEEYKAFRSAYKTRGDKGYGILTLESYFEYAENDAFFKLLKKLGSTDNVVTGHNHCDGYSVLFDGIVYTSVVKTGDIYTAKSWDNGNRGGTLFKFVNTGSGLEIVSERLFA
ncbi:MAG: metallophosphoesterase [Clostridiales bacterium]|jgi:predicted phosphodiesterase|nr:metallophosphoesterase [Clostridiales bacterium]